MKKLIIFAILLSGCASTPKPSLENLMRQSYYIGCGEAKLAMIEGRLQDHEAQVKGHLAACEAKSKRFDLRQAGGYRGDLETTWKVDPKELSPRNARWK